MGCLHSLALPMKLEVYVLYISTVASQIFMGYDESGFFRFIDLLKFPVQTWKAYSLGLSFGSAQ